MFPQLHLPGLSFVIPTYGLCVVTGILLCFYWLWKTAPERGFGREMTLQLALLTGNIAILGAHLFYVIVLRTNSFLQDPFIFFHFSEGGFVSYGAFIFGAITAIAYLKAKKIPLLDGLDFTVTAVPIMIIFIRIGCMCAGCCFGKPTTSWLHFTFTDPHTPAGQVYLNTPLVPVQLYNMLDGVFLFVVVNWLYARRQFSGQVAIAFSILYPINRGILEFFRGDDAARGVYFHHMISTAQFTGLFILCLSIPFYFLLQKRTIPAV